MLACRAALAAALAAAVSCGCASMEPDAPVDPSTERQILDRIEKMGTLRGVELEENIRMLGEFLGGISVPYMVDALRSHGNPKVRGGVASSLGVSQDGRAVQALADAAAGDSDTGVRLTAAYSLLLFRDARGFPILFEALRSDDPMRRRVGIDRLRELTGLDHGYEPQAAPPRREEAVARWEAWFKEVGPTGASASIRGPRRSATRQ